MPGVIPEKVNKIDWYHHYLSKKVILTTPSTYGQLVGEERPFLKVVRRYAPKGGKILEAGCGLARTAIVMAKNGYRVTVLDRDEKMLELARQNARMVSAHLRFLKMDFFRLPKTARKSKYDAITHGGVLEHYSIAEIRRALKIQLRLAPLIVFSVPTTSRFNRQYFHDSIHRHLWSALFWERKVLKGFPIVFSKKVHDRKDSLVVVIKR